MLAAEVARIVAMDVPVLCLDTCTILDIMRDPTRENIRAHESTAALQVLAALENGPKLVCLIADQVRLEFDEHTTQVQEETENALKRIRKQVEHVNETVIALGGIGSIDLGHFATHVNRAKAIVDRLLAAAERAPQSEEIASRALLRVNQARTPASKGKESMKDCVVIETYLDMATRLRAEGLISKLVFASSNIKDYVGSSGGYLKPDLGSEFARLSMDYAPNLAAARHLLGL